MSEVATAAAEGLAPIPATDLGPEQRVQLVGQAIEMALSRSIRDAGFHRESGRFDRPRVFLSAAFGNGDDGIGLKVWVTLDVQMTDQEIGIAETTVRRAQAAVALQRLAEERAAVLWREAGYQPDRQGTVHLQQEEVPA